MALLLSNRSDDNPEEGIDSDIEHNMRTLCLNSIDLIHTQFIPDLFRNLLQVGCFDQ